MITKINEAIVWHDGRPCKVSETPVEASPWKTMAGGILSAHNKGTGTDLNIYFDNLISHDITYVGIIQTAIASGLKKFPVPYAMTNCHNSLCAVGGTINEDDHIFGLSAARKFGGIYVPANQAVIHQFAREMMAGCGKMILGSDSHTRYGALGTMAVGEGGPEIVKQLLGDSYDIPYPKVTLVYLTGTPKQGVGPHDVALALCGAVYKDGFVKNHVLEFAGPGVSQLSMDYRIGIDVMTTETACLSSIWQTDSKVEEYLTLRGRGEEYRKLEPQEGACYDRETEKRLEQQLEGKKVDLASKLRDGKLMIDQGVIAGCAGGMFENIAEAAAILHGHSVGNGYFNLSVYPPSVPVNVELINKGIQQDLMLSGALLKSCFCGPCFGAGDVPGNGALSIRHTTRNFPNREGSKPGDGQISYVALMDARSIAATARNQGVLTAATDIDYTVPADMSYGFDSTVYENRVYFGYDKPLEDEALIYGPNIIPWPEIPAMPEDLTLELASVIHDPVTTTDELIPSGETSSYRSNPMKLATFALSRRDPEYVQRAKDIQAKGIYSCIFAECPGDGSAREQAASCQRILGGAANICRKFATKRYRSNCINWGMLPLTLSEDIPFDYQPGDQLILPGIRAAVESGADEVTGTINGTSYTFSIGPLTDREREILLAGCLMNWYALRNSED